MKLKRFVSFILSLFVLFFSLFSNYDNVNAFDIPTAFWGTLEASRAFWTALNTGGGLKNGVSLSQFERSGREDIQEFQTQVLIAYTAFCIYKEKIALKLGHPDWTEEQLVNEATIKGNLDVDNFKRNAIDVDNTTGQVTIKDWGYWREFCDEFQKIAKSGVQGDSMNDNTVIIPKVHSHNNSVYNATPLDNRGSNTFLYNDHYYLDRGQVASVSYNNSQYTISSVSYEITGVPTDRVRIPYLAIYFTSSKFYLNTLYVDVNRLSGSVIGNFSNQLYEYSNSGVNASQMIEAIIEHTNLPIYINETGGIVPQEFWENYVSNFSVSSGGSVVEDYQNDISSALDNTEVGSSIKQGGTEKKALVEIGDVPIKRSSLATDEDIASGVIGWDIPDARTLESAIAEPQTEEEEIKATGIISVPEDALINSASDSTVVAWDKDVAITIPTTEDDSIPTTIDDVISIQGGEFYPTQVDITEFFPFCIPFDIAYCVNKFRVSVGSAPIIHIPIVYPRALQGVLGQSYDVIIDFNDYIVLRNVIRYFILLLFIIGLMQVTRNLIRG